MVGIIGIFVAATSFAAFLILDYMLKQSRRLGHIDDVYGLCTFGTPKADSQYFDERCAEILNDARESHREHIYVHNKFVRTDSMDILGFDKSTTIGVSDPSKHFDVKVLEGKSQTGSGLDPEDVVVIYPIFGKDWMEELDKITDLKGALKKGIVLQREGVRITITKDSIAVLDPRVSANEMGARTTGVTDFIAIKLRKKEHEAFASNFGREGVDVLNPHCEASKVRTFGGFEVSNQGELLVCPIIHYRDEGPKDGDKHGFEHMRGVVVKVRKGMSKPDSAHAPFLPKAITDVLDRRWSKAT